MSHAVPSGGPEPAPQSRDIAEVPVPDHSDPDEPREQLVTLTVEHMDGLRIDRVTLAVLDGSPDGGT